jgi:hypothetical protein
MKIIIMLKVYLFLGKYISEVEAKQRQKDINLL